MNTRLQNAVRKSGSRDEIFNALDSHDILDGDLCTLLEAYGKTSLFHKTAAADVQIHIRRIAKNFLSSGKFLHIFPSFLCRIADGNEEYYFRLGVACFLEDSLSIQLPALPAKHLAPLVDVLSNTVENSQLRSQSAIALAVQVRALKEVETSIYYIQILTSVWQKEVALYKKERVTDTKYKALEGIALGIRYLGESITRQTLDIHHNSLLHL